MGIEAYFKMLAGCNAWANQVLYVAVATLSDADYRADRGAFFKSVHGTLNHLLVADRIWLHRFTGTGDFPVALDGILHDDLTCLAQARQNEDRRLADWVEGLDKSAFASQLMYTRVTGPELISQPLGDALLHVFNHQTHHRGQVHAIMTGLGVRAPALDLVLFQRHAGLSHVISNPSTHSIV